MKKELSWHMKKLINRFVILILCFLVIATVVSTAPQRTFAEEYKSKDFDESKYWYMKENHLNIDGLRKEIEKLKEHIEKNKEKLIKDPIKIAVIDTGYTESANAGHSMWDVVYRVNGQIVGANTIKEKAESDITDDVGHGTQVVNLIGLLLDRLGLKDYIKIMPIKAGSKDKENPNKGSFDSASIVRAIRWAAERGANIINMSFGTTDKEWAEKSEIRNEISKHIRKVLFFASAGNEGENTKFYPANMLNDIVSVMSYKEADGKIYMYQSNYGDHFSFAAPGKDILTIDATNQLGTINATSAATPLGAYVASLIMFKIKVLRLVDGKNEDTVPSPDTTKRILMSGMDEFETEINSKKYKIKKINPLKAMGNTTIENDLKPDGMQVEIYKTEGVSIERTKLGNKALVSKDKKENLRYGLVKGVMFRANVFPSQKVDVRKHVQWYVLKENGEWQKQITFGEFFYFEPSLETKKIKAVFKYKNKNGEEFLYEDIIEIEIKNVEADYENMNYVYRKNANKLSYVNERLYYKKHITTFVVKGLYGTDREEYTWWVNGEKQTVKHPGRLVMVPKKAGVYKIELKYNNKNNNYPAKTIASFNINVLNTVMPLWGIFLCIGGVIFIGVVGGLLIISIVRMYRTHKASVKIINDMYRSIRNIEESRCHTTEQCGEVTEDTKDISEKEENKEIESDTPEKSDQTEEKKDEDATI